MSDPSDFEVIRDGLARLDPETRHQVLEAMAVLRGLPVPVAVRVLADGALVRPGRLRVIHAG